MQRKVVGFVVLVLLLAALGVARASNTDEATLTAQVSSAEHETAEGYFSIGPDTTLMVKPGTDLHRFLARQNGHKVRITVAAAAPELSRLEK